MLDLAASAGVNYSSSSSSVDEPVDAASAEHFLGADATQPPPRRRYGAPRYNDSSHNSDGSNKYAFVIGVGATVPIGNTYHYDTGSYGFQVSVGRNFNKKFGVVAQFDFDHFGLEKLTLHNQSDLPQYFGEDGQGLDGNAHVWSFSLNPTYNFISGDTFGAYAVVGAGFYHKVTNFTYPQNECLDEFCQFEETVNANIDHYTSNAPGFNGGLGLTYKFSRFASERFFLEARYVFVDNSQKTGVTLANENTYSGNNLYPANSNRTTYIPIKVGIRF